MVTKGVQGLGITEWAQLWREDQSLRKLVDSSIFLDNICLKNILTEESYVRLSVRAR